MKKSTAERAAEKGMDKREYARSEHNAKYMNRPEVVAAQRRNVGLQREVIRKRRELYERNKRRIESGEAY
jgi:hypothetical protein